MNIIQHAHQFDRGSRKVCLALGMFDGVHLGHQRVLRQTVDDAQTQGATSVAVTFDQHPSVVVAPERTPPLIYSLAQRLREIAALGIETILLIHFDRAFSEQTGEAFIRGLARDFGSIQSVCIGANFCFGFKRTGNVTLLEALGEEFKFAVRALPPVASKGEVVSSTRIREVVQTGDLTRAAELLGRAYAVEGPVVAGDQMGQRLGFPTANLEVSGLVLPPTGVYAGQARVADQAYRAVANLGYRPTLRQPTPELRVEVHLLDFNSNLYGRNLEFTFAKRLRGEEKFASVEALKEQIEKDVSEARRGP